MIQNTSENISRLKLLFQAFFVFIASVSILAVSGCLPTDPVLDTTGDLISTDFRIGTGAAISRDSTVITQIGFAFIGKLKDSSVFSPQSGTILALVGAPELNGSVGYGLDSMMRGMRVGGYRRIVVPPRFGFGNRVSGNIPANSTLVYDIELKSVEELIKQDMSVGTGDTVKLGSNVFVNYVGRLTNGSIFDASTSGNPFSFRAGSRQVILGWDIGLLGMRVGGKRRLTIPSLLGYGAQGSAPRIPANATLVFDIELLSSTN
jgi:FKBP-type peptidyl-prolyl cis-trans isomerase